jgi:integrase
MVARNLLTAKAIQAAKPASKEYTMGDGDGLFLRVLPSGKKTWILVYTHGKRRPKMALGDLEDVSLAAVRERAKLERQRLAVGDDPRVALIAKEAEHALKLAEMEAQAIGLAAQELTFRDMFKAWIENGVSRSDGNKSLSKAFEKHILPALGEKLVRELTETDVRDVLRKVGRDDGKGRTAVVLASGLRQMMRWAEKRKPWRPLLVDGNPADLVEPKEVVRIDYDLANECDRVLSAREICMLQTIVETLERKHANAPDRRVACRPLNPKTRLAMWIMLSTCCRVGELSMARWEHVDLDKGEWLVPRQNSKTKTEWMVFLSDFARRNFKALYALTGDTPWCFPSSDKESHMCVKTISKQIGDRQVQFKNRKTLKGRRNDNTLVLPGGAWTPHDLRRSGSTIMQSLGVVDGIRERCLNHVVGRKIGRVYGRYEFAAEKRKAWALLGQHLDKILGGKAVDAG